MRFLLDTNILIPLEDSNVVLGKSFSGFVRLAMQHGHSLFYHPASKKDIARDADEKRRERTLERLSKYIELPNPPSCPWNEFVTNENDAVDNEILYAIKRDAVHALVTEDQGIHAKAKNYELGHRVYYIQTAEAWLNQLHSEHPVVLPNISEVELYLLDVRLSFFDSLRRSYSDFDGWFSRASQKGRKAWIYKCEETKELEALCIYAVQKDQIITDDRKILQGNALKLCTFKVAENVRGRKIGELFLKAAFYYATNNRIENIFITVKKGEQQPLVDMLKDFGFFEFGLHNDEISYVKSHPISAPLDSTAMTLSPFCYHRRYFPHYREDENIQKLIIPIKPEYHAILFPDCPVPQQFPQQLELFVSHSDVGNAIKLAYLCHAPLLKIDSGDIIIFYRSTDFKMLTTLGIVENSFISQSVEEIAGVVSRRTVYNFEEIKKMARKPTRVILFRLVKHFAKPLEYKWLKSQKIVSGNIQTIRLIDTEKYNRIRSYV